MKKLTKIWSVGLTLALVCSLLLFAAPVPVAAAPGNMSWTAQPLPSGTSNVIQHESDITDIAVAADGTTVYVVDSENGTAYISTTAGQAFTALVSNTSKAAVVAVAVAPDDPQVVATANLTHVLTSTNSGTTWSNLGALPATWVNSEITDVAVGPVRAGTLLGREYAVSVADPNTDNTNTGSGAVGDVLIIGGTATWASAASTTGITGQFDYMSVTFSPNFVGDRVLVAVGANVTNGVFLHLLNNAQKKQVLAATALHSVSTDYQTTGADVADIVAADIALPSDFDPSTGGGRRSYVAIGTAATFTNDDVYRIDNTESRALGGVSALALKSVAYAGTIDEGTLFIGANDDNTIKLSTNPQVSLPTWTTCKKEPGLGAGASTATVVRVAADFATTSRVFAGVTGSESAFHVSNNAGVSFNAESLIDNGEVSNTVVAVQSLRLTSDGSYLYVATDDGAQLSLWKSSAPVSPTSWSRVYVVTATGPGLVRLNPDWTDAPVVYLTDLTLNGVIYRSADGGDIFSTRASPTSQTITDMAVQDANTVYCAAGTSVYRSTTGCWTWGLPKSAKVTTVVSLAIAKEDHLIVGGTSACSYSTDGGTSFNKISSGLAGSGALQVLADDGYDANNVIYAGGNNSNLYRFIVGESSAWEDLANPAASAIVELGMANKTVYAITSGNGTDRNLAPTAATATVAAIWDTMDVGSVTSVADGTVGANVLYTVAGASLYGYDDHFATTKPEVTGPADGGTLGIDPVNGRADPFVITVNPVGTGIGAGNRIDIAFKEEGEPWRPAPTIGNAGVSATGPTIVVNNAVLTAAAYLLKANTTYQFRVRFDNQVSNDVVRTPWSDGVTLKIAGGTVVQQPHAGPVILSPQGGATTGLTPGISWAPYSAATKYQIILATDPTLKNRVAGTPAFVEASAWQPAENLAYGTTYFFAITAVEPTVSPQAIGSFTTMVKPIAPPAPAPPVVVREQPTPPAPIINIPPAPTPTPITPAFIWAIVIIGFILVIAVIVLIVRTRRPM